MLEIDPIQALSDNYVWLLRSPGSKIATLVDPGETIGIMKVMARLKLDLGAILVTHHHGDHTGGIRSLRQLYPEAVVYGPAGEAITGVTHPVTEGDAISLPGIDASFQVMEVPGHTAGHVAYYGEGALFCGDTLFAAGCGRVFDGTMAQMAASLERIAALPVDTQLYCAHEYTLDNLGFAQWVEPESKAVLQRLENAQQLRGQHRPTVPSSLALELETNPFLRTQLPAVIAMAERQAGRTLSNRAEVFEVLRTWKDQEYD